MCDIYAGVAQYTLIQYWLCVPVCKYFALE